MTSIQAIVICLFLYAFVVTLTAFVMAFEIGECRREIKRLTRTLHPITFEQHETEALWLAQPSRDELADWTRKPGYDWRQR